MKIAIVSDYFLDYVGGAQTSIQEQKASLEEAGNEVLLIAHTRRGSARGPGPPPWPGTKPPASTMTQPGCARRAARNRPVHNGS